MNNRRPSFRAMQIVRHGGIFGYVLDTRTGVKVRFPDPHDSSCHTEVTFHSNGTLLGEGEQTLFRAEQPKGIESVCREMSCKLEEVTIRLNKNKSKSIGELLEEDDGEEGL